MPDLPILAVSLASTVLAGIITFEIGTPEPIHSVEAQAAPQRPPIEVARMRQPEVDASAAADAAIARPLFSMTRRPPPEVVAGAATGSRAEPPRLTGIWLTANDRRAIFAQHGAGAGTSSAAKGEGDHIDDFTVLRIVPGLVVLVDAEGSERRMTLGADPAGRAAGASAVAAARIVVAERAAAQTRVLDVLRTIPSETAHLGPPGGPAPLRPAR